MNTNKIWIVSYYDADQIIITAFNNYEAAYNMYKYELDKHKIVNFDEAPIYNKYIINDK